MRLRGLNAGEEGSTGLMAEVRSHTTEARFESLGDGDDSLVRLPATRESRE